MGTCSAQIPVRRDSDFSSSFTFPPCRHTNTAVPTASTILPVRRRCPNTNRASMFCVRHVSPQIQPDGLALWCFRETMSMRKISRRWIGVPLGRAVAESCDNQPVSVHCLRPTDSVPFVRPPNSSCFQMAEGLLRVGAEPRRHERPTSPLGIRRACPTAGEAVEAPMAAGDRQGRCSDALHRENGMLRLASVC